MAIFRKLGKGVGTVTGGLVGGSVKLLGKAVDSKWVEEVGDGIKKTSIISFDSAGQFIDGAVHGIYGTVAHDKIAQQEGFGDIKDSTMRTVNGIESVVSYTAKNTGEVFEGISSGDNKRVVEGIKNVGKVAAVATLAVGALDLIDGADGADINVK